MNSITNISRNIIVISIVSTLLMLSLCLFIWFDTYAQRGDAIQLQASTTPEETLFDLANNLSKERSLTHTILAQKANSSEELDQFYDTAVESERLMDLAANQIRDSRNSNAILVEHSYSNESIEKLLSNLADSFDRISILSSIVFPQSTISLTDRDENIRMQLFDAYGNLIKEVNNLRIRTQFLPDNYYKNVVSTNSLKNAVWDLRESTSQTRSMLSAFLKKSENKSLRDLNAEGLLFRIYQQQQNAEQALFEFKEFSDSNNVDKKLNDRLNALASQFQENYRPLEKVVVESLATKSPASLSAEQWLSGTNKFRIAIEAMETETISETIESSKRIKKSALKIQIGGSLLLVICIYMAITSIRTARNIQHRATHDDLTQLPNRHYFSENLESFFIDTIRPGSSVSLLKIDLNRFKTVNDTMGHAIGDKLLKKTGQRLKKATSDEMITARMGGDEFAVLVSDFDKDSCEKLATKIVKEIEKPLRVRDSVVNIGASIGISTCPEDADTAESLQLSSDFAMFFAKREAGKNGSSIQFYNRELVEKFEDRMQTEKDLVAAIENNELELHYQPQVNLSDQRASAVEALVRWNHPVKGLVPPFQFIEIAEESGLMPSLGKWVTEEAIRQAAVWQSETDLGLRVAINVSAHQITQEGFVQHVLNTLKKHQLSHEYVEIEITESVFISDSNRAADTLLKLRNAGIKMALDDFGTGYSSLSKLQDLPVDTLKIDRAFISKLDSSSEASQSVTATITSIANTLGLETVAEGVETVDQLETVENLGIDVVQGYFYSKPLASADIPDTIRNLNDLVSTNKKAA